MGASYADCTVEARSFFKKKDSQRSAAGNLTSKESVFATGGGDVGKVRHDEGDEVGGHGDAPLEAVPHPALLTFPGFVEKSPSQNDKPGENAF